MAIDRLYYFTLSVLTFAFCCISHYHMWPEKGYAPHSNVGNKFRKDPKKHPQEQEQGQHKKKDRKDRKDRKKKRNDSDAHNHHRRDDDDTSLDEGEWIADFNRERRGSAHKQHADDDIPSSAAAQAAGRPRRVSFEDEQRPDLRGE